ncbi:MAG: hypothetical protein ALECFALPRED_004510 [Alectoria fallacina]|uniref:Uncharacterized protein n=1 Tax=Alectoria fallacina TaxID=1903189 RepID=A0A8H3IWR5_9LECA|nr:MAG: hypothetical protein ALECFALPRED_004510 [Alectoria fallacina]
MSVSLLSNSSLTTNVSAYDGIFSTFPAPIAPDVINCDEFYSVGQPIILEECRSAWDLLPRGSKNYPWYTDPDSGPASTSQLRLPLEIGHRSCRIKFSASGKYAEEVNFPIYISGTTMRDMVGRIIDDCAGARERRKQTPWGGVGTKYIQRTLDWLMDPSTGFPENLDIPRSTTFLTAMVYAHYRPIVYEPGAQSKEISSVFLKWIDAAAGRLPHTSPFWGVLANRYFYVWKANEGQGSHGRLPHWWDDVQARPHFELGRANGTNDTDGGISITRRDARRRI